MPRTLLLAACLGALACLAPAQEPKALKVGFVGSDADPYWKVVEAGARKAADEAKAELLFKLNPDGNSTTQLKAIDDLVAAKVDGVVVSLLDFKAQYDGMAKVGKAVPLAYFNCDLNGTNRVYAAVSDHKQGGKLAGQLIKEARPDGATVVLFTGRSQAAFSKDRFQAFAAELGIADPEKDTKSKDGKYKLLYREPVQDGVNPAQARENALDALKQLKDEPNACLVGLWAYHGPAIAQAVKEANLAGKVTIVAFDDQAPTLQGVEDGLIHAAVVQDAREMAYKTVKAVLAKARGEAVKGPPGGLEWVPHRAATKAGGDGRLKARELNAELTKILAP